MHIFCEPICCPSCWASLKEDLRKLEALHWICMDLQCYFAIMLFRSILTFSACSLQWAPGWLCSASLSPWSSALDAWAGDPTSGACSVSYAVKISYSIACLIALQNDEHVQLKKHSPRGVSIARNAWNARNARNAQNWIPVALGITPPDSEKCQISRHRLALQIPCRPVSSRLLMYSTKLGKFLTTSATCPRRSCTACWAICNQ